MKMIIDIPKEDYLKLIKTDENGEKEIPLVLLMSLWDCVRYKCTPLPKGHGDLISRQAVLDLCGTGKWLEEYRAEENGVKTRGYDTLKMINYTKLLKLPAIPQTDYENYEEFGWCKGCKEYDTEKHCCHRYSSFIRESLQDNINAVLEDIKAEMEKEQAECPYPLDIEHAITIIDKYISRKE